VTAGLSNTQRLALGQNPDGGLEALVEDCRVAAANEVIAAHGGPVRTPEAFDALVKIARSELAGRVSAILRMIVPILEQAHQLSVVLDRSRGEAADDVREQLTSLLFPGFVAELGSARLRDLPRYLAAAKFRLEALPASAQRDQQAMDVLDRVYAAYDRLLSSLPEERRTARDVDAISWMIEELRVSLFAQSLGTPTPISEKRVLKAIEAIKR